MNDQKIIPNIWFVTRGGLMAGVVEYYQNIFGSQFSHGPVSALGETPSGYAEICMVEIFGQKYMLLSTAREHHPLNDAISLQINCAGQQEIDTYWNYFTLEGSASQCGWCTDKYGLRWQVLPANMEELMKSPGAVEVMMKQTKIVIAEYPQ